MKLDSWERKFIQDILEYAGHEDWFQSDFVQKAGMTEDEFDRRFYRLKDKVKNEP